MIADRWQRINSLYQEAMARTASQRGAFLAEACQGDHSLLREIESLLASPDTQFNVDAETPSVRFEPGDVVGSYKLEAPIGEGGMGQVFRAVDTRLHRTVAIKVLTVNMSDPVHRRRFLQEAQAASALNHPNIVTVHDICAHRGIDFLVMEHISGQTLKDLIAARPIPFEVLLQIGVQVASALAAAHSAGIVHRDIKPANVMVTADQQVKVLDFGVAKMTTSPNENLGPNSPDGTPTLGDPTVAGALMGTLAYMSPEQTRGEPVDRRSDIFSLGSVLYEASTGVRAFRGDNMFTIIHAIGTETPQAPSTLRSELPTAFDQLIALCLSKKPVDRPASAADVVKALRSIASSPDRIPERRTDGRSTLAVLPFQFRTSVTDDQFLSVALTDAVIHRLSSTGKLLVRPMAAVMKYAGKETEWGQAARELNVDLVVEGTIQKVGPRVRVLVQAHRLADSFTLHSAKFDGAMDDLFGLQDRIADSVSDVFLPREKTSAEPAIPPTKNPLAYELYLRAVDRIAYMDKFDTEIAIEMLGRVIGLDPSFADAWGRLAQAYTQMGLHLDPDPQWFDRAEHAIARTLELDPVHCDALCARGQILWSPARSFQNRPALRALNASIKINSTREIPHFARGAVLFHLGFYTEAERDSEHVLLTNPGHVMSLVGKGVIALYRGDYAAASEHMERVLSLNPSNVHANIFSADPAILSGRFDFAWEKIRKASQLFPDEPQLVAQQSLMLAYEGNFQKAEELADQALASKRSLTHTHHTWHDTAGTYAMCGKPEKAITQLRRCSEMGLPNYLLFGSDPRLRALHRNPEFETLMSSLRRDHDAYRQEFGLAE